jgi:hypothetical protein
MFMHLFLILGSAEKKTILKKVPQGFGLKSEIKEMIRQKNDNSSPDAELPEIKKKLATKRAKRIERQKNKCQTVLRIM